MRCNVNGMDQTTAGILKIGRLCSEDWSGLVHEECEGHGQVRQRR